MHFVPRHVEFIVHQHRRTDRVHRQHGHDVGHQPLELFSSQRVVGRAASDKHRVRQAMVQERLPIGRRAQSRQQAIHYRHVLRPDVAEPCNLVAGRQGRRDERQGVEISTKDGELHGAWNSRYSAG